MEVFLCPIPSRTLSEIAWNRDRCSSHLLCQSSNSKLNVLRSLLVSNRELAGRMAGVGYSEEGIARMESGESLSCLSVARASDTTNRASSHQVVSPPATR